MSIFVLFILGVSYEQTTNSNGKPREIEQAKNIQKVIQSRPNEKFLIHSGFDHALEGKHNYWEKAMAGRLTEFTGINPLTINQVVYSEKSKPEFNHPLLKAFNIKESSIIIDKENNPLRYDRGEAWNDLAVFHPTTKYVNNRPKWLFEYGNKNISIALTEIQIEGMTCEMGCVTTIRNKVNRIKGVTNFEMDFDAERSSDYSTIQFDSRLTSSEDIQKTIETIAQGIYAVVDLQEFELTK